MIGHGDDRRSGDLRVRVGALAGAYSRRGPEEDLHRMMRCRMCKRPSSEMRPAKREEVPRGIALHAYRCVIPH